MKKKQQSKRCVCGCGRIVPDHANFGGPACVLRIMARDPRMRALLGENLDEALKIAEEQERDMS